MDDFKNIARLDASIPPSCSSARVCACLTRCIPWLRHFVRWWVGAQKLRHLDLLLASPWSVRISSDIGVPLRQPLDVSVPNAVSFIAQKLLIHHDRKSDKRAQDALYIHDTLDLFGRELPSLRALWVDRVRPSLPKKTAATVERLCKEQFGAVTDVIRSAARIPKDRIVTPERIQAACAYGLGEIFIGAENISR